MNRLFELDLDEILQKIFLSLDSMSLKNCKCVSNEWFNFIQRRLWNSKPARNQLHNRLINQWKFSEPLVTEQRGGGRMGVNFLVCDDELIVCGYTRGQARAYDLETGELRFEIQCNTQSTMIYDEVQLDLGKTVIGSVSENGCVSIWNKVDGRKLYQEKHHGEYQNVCGLKVTDEYVLTGGGDGSLVMLESIEGAWKITHEMLDNRDGINHIDADGKWAVTGTVKGINLWDLEEHKMVKSVKKLNTQVCMLSFTYPHAFVVGGQDWAGVQIWDMVKCELVRHVAQDGKYFHNIHFNGRLLTVCELNITEENDEELSVEVFDALELLDSKIESKNLWKKSYNYSPEANMHNLHVEQINAVSNQTSLIVAHVSRFSILNYWKDRIIPSREFEPDEPIEDVDMILEEEDSEWDTEESFYDTEENDDLE